MTPTIEPAHKRTPKVQITYEVDAGGVVEKRELPFVVGVMADLSGHPERPLPNLRERKFVETDANNLDHVLDKAAPRLAFKVDNKLTDDDTRLNVELRFRCLADFNPDNVARQVHPLRMLLEMRLKLANLRSRLYGNDKLEEFLLRCVFNKDHLERISRESAVIGGSEYTSGQWGSGWHAAAPDVSPNPPAGAVEIHRESLLDEIIEESHLANGPEEREAARDSLSAFFSDVLSGEMVSSRDIEAMIANRIADIDRLLSKQLNAILHQAEFQRLESTWRGLHYLVAQTPTSYMLRIKILNISKRELYKDLTRAVEFDQSQIFRKVYEDEYGIFGGQPYAVLLGDYYFGRHPEDITILELLSQIASAAHAPLIAGVSPEMFNFQNFLELVNPRDLSKIFDNEAYLKWKSFRESEDSRYVGLALPRMLLRLPYGPDTLQAESFRYEEDTDGTEHEKYLWGNAAYAFGARLTRAFAAYYWCAEILGVERGGLIRDLPVHMYFSDEGGAAVKCPTEIPISDRRLSELTNLGFIALCHAKGTDCAAFFWAPSCHKPKLSLRDDSTTGARLAARLDYTFAFSRFAHYLKAITREKLHTFKTREELEQYLSVWIRQYVASADTSDPETLARSPLAEAAINVLETPGKPGAFTANLALRPRFQFANEPGQVRSSISLPISEMR